MEPAFISWWPSWSSFMHATRGSYSALIRLLLFVCFPLSLLCNPPLLCFYWVWDLINLSTVLNGSFYLFFQPEPFHTDTWKGKKVFSSYFWLVTLAIGRTQGYNNIAILPKINYPNVNIVWFYFTKLCPNITFSITWYLIYKYPSNMFTSSLHPGFHYRFEQHIGDIFKMSIKYNSKMAVSIEWCCKKVFSPLALSHPQKPVGGCCRFWQVISIAKIFTSCHWTVGFFSPLDTSVYQFSIIPSIIFATVYGSPSPPLLLEGLIIQLHTVIFFPLL